MPRGRHPRRKKREGEVWHKKTGPHKKHTHFVLCMRCRRAIVLSQMRSHVRRCFGMTKCFVCELPFPCRTPSCPWRFPDLPTIPTRYVEYFRRDPRKQLSIELFALERAAIRWLKGVLEKTPWVDR